MIFNVHAGHGKQDSKSCGAYTSLLKESVANRDVKHWVIEYLRKNSNTVYDCTIDYPSSATDCINKIVAKCNSNKVDYDCSIHFNSGRGDLKGDGSIGGAEVIIYDDSARAIATRVLNKLVALGFRNRGVKINKNLGVLRNTKAPAFLIEVCFVDDKDDVTLYNKLGCKRIAHAIAEGMVNKSLNYDLSGASSSTSSFTVTIVADSLNVRTGPGTSYPVATTVKKGGVYTIVETKDTWGKLKSGVGWINISSLYVKR